MPQCSWEQTVTHPSFFLSALVLCLPAGTTVSGVICALLLLWQKSPLSSFSPKKSSTIQTLAHLPSHFFPSHLVSNQLPLLRQLSQGVLKPVSLLLQPVRGWDTLMCYLFPDASGNRKVIFYSDAFGINHRQTGEKFVGQGRRFTLSCILQTGPKYGRMGSFSYPCMYVWFNDITLFSIPIRLTDTKST